MTFNTVQTENRRGNLKDLVCCLMASFLAWWCLGQSIPGLPGFSYFMIGVIILFYFSPVLLLGGKIYLSHALFFLSFLAMHFISKDPFELNPYYFSFIARLLLSFSFFMLLISLVDRVDLYARMTLVMMVTLCLIVAYLDWLHLFVYKSPFLSSSFIQHDYNYKGRAGKNTISFFLSILFPLFYARAAQKKTPFDIFMALLIAFSIVYTVSRAALISFVFSILFFPFIALQKKAFIKILVGLVGIYIFSSLFFGIGYQTFKLMKAGINVFEEQNLEEVQQEHGGEAFVNFEGRRGRHIQEALEGFLESPLIGKGVTAYLVHSEGSPTHNDFLSILHDFGLLGMFLFVMIFGLSAWDLWTIKDKVPLQHQWLWNGLMVTLISVFVQLLFINAYETIPLWFVLAGCQILKRSLSSQPLQKVHA